MPSVWVEDRKNKHGKNYLVRWEIEIPNPDKPGETIRIRDAESCGPSKQFANMRKDEILEQIQQGRAPKKRIDSMVTAGIFAEKFLAYSRRANAPNTTENFYRPAVTYLREFSGENQVLSLLDKERMVKYAEWLAGRGFAVNYVRILMRHLRAALEWAKREGWIMENPIPQGRQARGMIPKEIDVSRYVTEAEIEVLLRALPELPRRAAYFQLHTGLRGGELINLDWKMIHYPSDGKWEIDITRASAYGIESGFEVKTRRPRIIPIPDNAKYVMGTPQPAGQVFAGLTKGVLHEIGDRARDIGMGRVRNHDLRHTWATNFMYETGNLFELMGRGGWKSINSVAHYQHYRKRDKPVLYSPFSHYFPTKAQGARFKGKKGPKVSDGKI